jgi:hypothetical protein
VNGGYVEHGGGPDYRPGHGGAERSGSYSQSQSSSSSYGGSWGGGSFSSQPTSSAYG